MRCDACGRELEAVGPGPVTATGCWCRCDAGPARPELVEDLLERPPARVADELRERLLAVFG